MNLNSNLLFIYLPSVLWCRWLSDRRGIIKSSASKPVVMVFM